MTASSSIGWILVAAGIAVAGLTACSSDDSGWQPGGGAAGEPPAPPEYPPANELGQGTAEDGLAKLNEYRLLAGLEAVTGNNDASHACEGHLDYLIWESQNGKGTCYLSHTEGNTANPNNSTVNETAGKNSVIACGWRSDGKLQALPDAVDMWINSLYHRLPLLNNGLKEVGYASKGGYNCINYRPGTTKTKTEKVVLWPPDTMLNVPATFIGYEAPCPTKPDNPLSTNGQDCAGSGFIVTASWYGWNGFTAADQVQMFDEANTEVPLLVWYGDKITGHNPAAGYTPDTISLVPASALAKNTKYRVVIKASPGGEAQELEATFTTGERTK
jgi:hypothetical protein